MKYELEQTMKGFTLVKRELLPTGQAITKWDAGENKLKATSLMQRLNAFPESTLEICKDGLYVTWIGFIGYNRRRKLSARVREIEYTPTLEEIMKEVQNQPLTMVKLPDAVNREKVWMLTYATAVRDNVIVSNAILMADNALAHFDKLFTKTTKL